MKNLLITISSTEPIGNGRFFTIDELKKRSHAAVVEHLGREPKSEIEKSLVVQTLLRTTSGKQI